MSYATGGHTVLQHRYYVVWITKYRFKVLEGALRERIREIIRQVCDEIGVEIVAGMLSKEHVLVQIPPKLSVSEFVPLGRRALILQGPDGVPRPAQSLLGSPFLGQRILLHYQRQHHRRSHTSES